MVRIPSSGPNKHKALPTSSVTQEAGLSPSISTSMGGGWGRGAGEESPEKARWALFSELRSSLPAVGTDTNPKQGRWTQGYWLGQTGQKDECGGPWVITGQGP